MLFGFSLIFPLHILAAPIGYFAMIKGDVKVKRADQTLMPPVKAPIEPKDLVITGGDGKAKLIFNDDSSMFLSPNTRLEVQDFVIKEGKRNGSFFIHVGKIIAEVTKFIGGDSSFTVNSPTATVGVRGTGFEVVVAEVAGKMTTTVACTAGSLSVSALSATGAVVSSAVLTAGQTAIITSTGITMASAAAAAAGAAQLAGIQAGAATIAGIEVGTVAAAAAVAAAIATTVVISTTSDDNTTTHMTTYHH